MICKEACPSPNWFKEKLSYLLDPEGYKGIKFANPRNQREVLNWYKDAIAYADSIYDIRIAAIKELDETIAKKKAELAKLEVQYDHD